MLDKLRLGDFLVAALFVAGLLVMVRPKSQGPALVSSFTNGVTAIVKAVTGGGTW